MANEQSIRSAALTILSSWDPVAHNLTDYGTKTGFVFGSKLHRRGLGGCWTRNKQHDSKPKGDAWVCAALWGCGEAPRLSLIPGAVCLLQSLRRAERRRGEPVGRGLARQGAEVILARGFKARDARVDRLQPRIRTLARLAQNAVTPRRISGGTSKPNEKRKRAVSLGKIKIQR